METKELEHYLKVLIELDLFPKLRATLEGNFSKKEAEKIQQSQIITFINKLPDDYKNLKNRDEIIASTLIKMGMKTAWTDKKIEEIEMMKKNADKKTLGNKENLNNGEIER